MWPGLVAVPQQGRLEGILERVMIFGGGRAATRNEHASGKSSGRIRFVAQTQRQLLLHGNRQLQHRASFRACRPLLKESSCVASPAYVSIAQ